MSSLDYLRGLKEIKVTKEGVSEDWLRSMRSMSRSDIRIQALIEKRNSMIISLHAYYKYSISELVFMFKLSKSAICEILQHKQKWGRTKPCSVCQETMYQGSLNDAKWEIKAYCGKQCCYKARYRKRKGTTAKESYASVEKEQELLAKT